MNFDDVTPFGMWRKRNRANNKARKRVTFYRNCKSMFKIVKANEVKSLISYQKNFRKWNKLHCLAFSINKFYKNNENE